MALAVSDVLDIHGDRLILKIPTLLHQHPHQTSSGRDERKRHLSSSGRLPDEVLATIQRQNADERGNCQVVQIGVGDVVRRIKTDKTGVDVLDAVNVRSKSILRRCCGAGELFQSSNGTGVCHDRMD